VITPKKYLLWTTVPVSKILKITFLKVKTAYFRLVNKYSPASKSIDTGLIRLD